MSLSVAKQIERARARLDNAQAAVYAAAYPRRDIPFSGCRALATPETIAEYDAAVDALYAAEGQAIEKGRGWRNERGHYCEYPNRRNRR